MTDNTMAKRQREKEQTTNITQQTKDRATRTLLKKSLKIPKGQSETVYRKRTDNTMAKDTQTIIETSAKELITVNDLHLVVLLDCTER
jgi:hypothetical protein